MFGDFSTSVAIALMLCPWPRSRSILATQPLDLGHELWFRILCLGATTDAVRSVPGKGAIVAAALPAETGKGDELALSC